MMDHLCRGPRVLAAVPPLVKCFATRLASRTLLGGGAFEQPRRNGPAIGAKHEKIYIEVECQIVLKENAHA